MPETGRPRRCQSLAFPLLTIRPQNTRPQNNAIGRLSMVPALTLAGRDRRQSLVPKPRLVRIEQTGGTPASTRHDTTRSLVVAVDSDVPSGWPPLRQCDAHSPEAKTVLTAIPIPNAAIKPQIEVRFNRVVTEKGAVRLLPDVEDLQCVPMLLPSLKGESVFDRFLGFSSGRLSSRWPRRTRSASPRPGDSRRW